ncbi:MAG: leucine-rich repeat domain-containing protein [Clostridia bacterium]|nr:leucine-rich repeat domain-containing protein [Clostridia bacterium]
MFTPRKLAALLLGALLLCAALTAYAEECVSGDYTYLLLEDGTALILDYDGTEAHVIIPDHLDGHAVSAIGDGAFSNCASPVSITIPDSITSIDMNPFWACYRLKEILVSDQHPAFSSVGGVLFSRAANALIAYPNGLDAEQYAVPKGTAVIGDFAFADSNHLRSVILPGSVTAIGDTAFGFCRSLDSVSLPEGMVSIGAYAFRSCPSLASVSVPQSVSSIGFAAFPETAALITYDGSYAAEWAAGSGLIPRSVNAGE